MKERIAELEAENNKLKAENDRLCGIGDMPDMEEDFLVWISSTIEKEKWSGNYNRASRDEYIAHRVWLHYQHENGILRESNSYTIYNLELMVKHLKGHINHIRKVHDYQDQQGNEVTLQLRVAIVNASEFSRRDE